MMVLMGPAAAGVGYEQTDLWGLFCGLPAVLWAGEIAPRAYVNTPVGVSFLLARYPHAQGGLATEASSPLQDAELENDFYLGA